jgi:XTP/dITP diphosphohydrolase
VTDALRPLRVYVATKNAGKLEELQAIFAGSGLEPATCESYREAIEDADTYAGNAVLKARALAEQLRAGGTPDAAVLADDSGLEVDALGGRPGVLSARYGGRESTWAQRRALLLEEMAGVPDERRGARFVSALVLLLPAGEPYVAIGSVEGRITKAELGPGGFGYDPLFHYEPLGRTFAQISSWEKNAVSHRRRAADALLASLPARG